MVCCNHGKPLHGFRMPSFLFVLHSSRCATDEQLTKKCDRPPARPSALPSLTRRSEYSLDGHGCPEPAVCGGCRRSVLGSGAVDHADSSAGGTSLTQFTRLAVSLSGRLVGDLLSLLEEESNQRENSPIFFSPSSCKPARKQM